MTEGKEFIVIYGAPEAGEDEIVVDVNLGREEAEQNVTAEFGARVTNRAGTTAVVGLVITMLGALVMLLTAILFGLNYPDRWYPVGEGDANLIQLVTAMGIFAGLLLVVGNLMVGFGRQLHARGVLHSIRFLSPDAQQQE